MKNKNSNPSASPTAQIDKLQKVNINHDNTATFVCPKCRRSKVVDVSKYLGLERIVKAKMRCVCGYQYIALLDKRKFYRKPVKLKGTYSRLIGDIARDKNPLEIDGLSRTGLSGRFYGHLETGHRVLVEFALNNAQRTLIQKESKVIIVNGDKVGVEFLSSLNPSDEQDKALGFYLMNLK